MQGKLKYGVEFTRNLGNFQNVKPNFELTLDVATSENGDLASQLAELDEIKEVIVEQVDAWLVKKVEELDAELRG